MHLYCFKRERGFFRATKFRVDRLHIKNHIACSLGYNLDYWPQDEMVISPKQIDEVGGCAGVGLVWLSCRRAGLLSPMGLASAPQVREVAKERGLLLPRVILPISIHVDIKGSVEKLNSQVGRRCALAGV